ncbi:hypothetical protein, partial [Bordetella pertussis]|uniref:hypothetical protein n=1 Tax=Bordetella pertussis TaxID=520 RepID=UPI0021CBB37B
MRIAIQNLSRRRFVQGAGGLLLGLSLPPLARRAMAAGPQAGDGFARSRWPRACSATRPRDAAPASASWPRPPRA